MILSAVAAPAVMWMEAWKLCKPATTMLSGKVPIWHVARTLQLATPELSERLEPWQLAGEGWLGSIPFSKVIPAPGIGAPSCGKLPEMTWACTALDRKSTRLNSSHGYISYAV